MLGVALRLRGFMLAQAVGSPLLHRKVDVVGVGSNPPDELVPAFREAA